MDGKAVLGADMPVTAMTVVTPIDSCTLKSPTNLVSGAITEFPPRLWHKLTKAGLSVYHLLGVLTVRLHAWM